MKVSEAANTCDLKNSAGPWVTTKSMLGGLSWAVTSCSSNQLWRCRRSYVPPRMERMERKSHTVVKWDTVGCECSMMTNLLCVSLNLQWDKTPFKCSVLFSDLKVSLYIKSLPMRQYRHKVWSTMQLILKMNYVLRREKISDQHVNLLTANFEKTKFVNKKRKKRKQEQ